MIRLSGQADVVHEIGNDPAFLAIVDIARYAKDLADWPQSSIQDRDARTSSGPCAPRFKDRPGPRTR